MAKEKKHILPVGLWWAQRNLLKGTAHLTIARDCLYSHSSINKIDLSELYMEGNSELSEIETYNPKKQLAGKWLHHAHT